MTNEQVREQMDQLLTRLGKKYEGASLPKLLVQVHRDEILSLIQPLIDQARAEGRREVIEVVDDMLDSMGLDESAFKRSDWKRWQARKG